VLVLSADATPSRVSAALGAGATQYLTKPFDVEAFLATLDSLLATSARPRATLG